MSDPSEARKSNYMSAMLRGASIASCVILLGFVAMVALLFTVDPPEWSRQLIGTMVSTVNTLAALAAGFWLAQRAAAAARASTPPPPPPSAQEPPPTPACKPK